MTEETGLVLLLLCYIYKETWQHLLWYGLLAVFDWRKVGQPMRQRWCQALMLASYADMLGIPASGDESDR